MFIMSIKVTTALLAALTLIVLALAAGCQADAPAGQPGTPTAQARAPAGEAQAVSQPSPGHGMGKTLSSGMGYPISSIKEAPQDVQDLVNRSHAVVVGTISAVSDPLDELPYGKTKSDYPAEDLQLMHLRVTYYSIEIEEVLLDDGIVSAFPRLRLDDVHNPRRPQVGERFVFTLARNPDDQSYGVVADWMVLNVADGLKNYDGSDPAYDDATDEVSFLRAVRAAAGSYDFSEFSEWPDKQ